MSINYKVVINILGMLLILNGAFMLLCVPISLIYGEEHLTFIASGLLVISTGFILRILTRYSELYDVRKKEGYLVVTGGWLVMSFFGSLPYMISGAIPGLTDAFFETLSGFSTTGASILNDIESVDKGILFWRSMTQWIGGMGIIVLTIAILPFLGIGGIQLFIAESPGISPDKLKPRIKETAKRLWLIYVGLTVTEIFLLWLGGMSFYDAANHGMTTMATGGFSTKNASIAYFDSPFIQYVIILFMMLAGTNFSLTYFGLHWNFKKIVNNEEFRFYVGFIMSLTILVIILVSGISHGPFEESFRNSMFQVVSIVTTTGYVTYDYTSWSYLLTILFFMMLFAGASAGSTAGGIKIIRHIILLKNSILELKRIIHPSAVLPVRFNGRAVSTNITSNILAFMIIYIAVFGVGTIIMSSLGNDFETALGSTATCLGNVGPGIGSVGPANNFAHLSMSSKWFLSFLMIVGRLELFTVLVLFSPYYWRKF